MNDQERLSFAVIKDYQLTQRCRLQVTTAMATTQ